MKGVVIERALVTESEKSYFVPPIFEIISNTDTLSCISLLSDAPDTINAPNIVTIDCCILVIPNESADNSVDSPTVSITL